jgi:hypothetical protein
MPQDSYRTGSPRVRVSLLLVARQKLHSAHPRSAGNLVGNNIPSKHRKQSAFVPGSHNVGNSYATRENDRFRPLQKSDSISSLRRTAKPNGQPGGEFQWPMKNPFRRDIESPALSRTHATKKLPIPSLSLTTKRNAGREDLTNGTHALMPRFVNSAIAKVDGTEICTRKNGRGQKPRPGIECD